MWFFLGQCIVNLSVGGGGSTPSATRVPTVLCCLFPAAVARAKNERRRRTFAVFQGRHYLPYYYIFWNLFIAIAEDKKPITKHQMSANIDITTIWKKETAWWQLWQWQKMWLIFVERYLFLVTSWCNEKSRSIFERLPTRRVCFCLVAFNILTYPRQDKLLFLECKIRPRYIFYWAYFLPKFNEGKRKMYVCLAKVS